MTDETICWQFGLCRQMIFKIFMHAILLAIFLLGSVFGAPTDRLILYDNTSDKTVSYEARLAEGIDAFYKTDWEKAERIFLELKREEPDNPMPHFFSSMMPFWEYFFIEQTSKNAKEFLVKSEKAIKLSEKKLQNSPSDTTMVLMLSGLYGYRSLVAAGESNYRVALQSGLTGFNYTRKLLSINSDRADARIGRGMFYYMVGSIPSGMRWASNMVGFRGDIEQGFEELKLAAESDSYISNDARLMLMYLYDKEERYEEALVYAGQLTEAFPENVIFKFKKAQVYQNTGNIEKAASLYMEIIDTNNPDLEGLTDICRKKLIEVENLSAKY